MRNIPGSAFGQRSVDRFGDDRPWVIHKETMLQFEC
jgi:hypothetical protein